MDELTREAIEGYEPSYAERIPDWTEGAAYWPAHFGTTAAEINSGDWLGAAQDEAAAAALRHLGVANEAAGMVAGHATNAGYEAGGMAWAQQRVTAAIALAEGDGFPVGNDLKPTDPAPSPIPQVQQAREKVRATHEKEIGRLATEMRELSTSIAAKVDQRTADLTATTRYADGQPIGGVQMVDNKFKVDGPLENEPAIPPVGGEEYIGGAAMTTPLEKGLGGPPLPPPPLPAVPVPPPPKCGYGEYAKDAGTTAMHTAMEAAGAMALPAEGPGAVGGVLGLTWGAKTIGEDAQKMIDCLERGLG